MHFALGDNVDTRETTRRDMPSGREKLSGVQAGRGVAALLVVLYHATRGLSLPQYLGFIPFGNIFGFGHAGVDFFFVLSGFIITHAHTEDIGKPERFYRYAWRRITRIYPLYWFVTFIEVVRAFFSPDPVIRLAPSHIVDSLLLLPASMEPLVSVGWTLRSEMLFYIAFGLTVLDRRFCRPLVITALLFVAIGVVSPPGDPWANLLLSSFNIQFLMGIAAARFLARRRVPNPAAVLICGALGFLAVGGLEVLGVVPLNGIVARSLYGAAATAILLGLVEAERGGSIRFAARWVMIGNASYSLYLIHLTIMPLLVRACARFGLLAVLPASVVVAAITALAVAASLALHLGLEVPLMNFIRKHTPRVCR
jgi:exopolysaccharide production protein ExoZ